MTKIYIDENFSPYLAEGFDVFQKHLNSNERMQFEVLSIKKEFGKGAKDEDWIPKVGKEGGIVITQDFRIQTQRHQKELYIQSGIGILFLKPPSNNGFTYWEMVKKIINEWDNIKQIVRKNKTPFAFKCSSRTSFEKME